MKKIVAKIKDEAAFDSLVTYINNGEGIHMFSYTMKIKIDVVIEVINDTSQNVLNIITLLKDVTQATDYKIMDIPDSQITENRKSQHDALVASGVTAHTTEQDKVDTAEFQRLLPLAKSLLLGNEDTPQLEAMSYSELEDYYTKFFELHELIVLYYYTLHNTIPSNTQIKTTNNTIPEIEMLSYLRMRNVL